MQFSSQNKHLFLETKDSYTPPVHKTQNQPSGLLCRFQLSSTTANDLICL